MTRKQKIIYIVGSAVIGIAAVLIILFGLMLGGVIGAGSNKLVISSASHEFVYDGEEHTDDNWQLLSGKLSKGHTVVAKVSGSRKDKGSSLNYITVTIVDSNGADVTDQYNIDYRVGTLTVLARPITIKTEGAEKTYDGEELSRREWDIANGITKGSIVKGQEISVELNAAITDAGEVENAAQVSITADGEDVTSNYDITYDTGILKVNPIEFHFITPTLSKTYDGLPLYSDPADFTLVSGEVLSGHKIDYIKVVGTITKVGSVENSVEIKISAANGTDITKNYLAVIDSGTLTVHGIQITISTSSSEKVYDGKPLVNGEWTLYEGTPLADGHKISKLVMPAVQTNAGVCPNEISQLTIVNSKGEDVTENYEINYSIGTLVVLPRQLTVQSGSASKEYDGKPLKCNQWQFTSYYQPVSGHKAEVVISGSRILPGQCDNTIAQVIIWDKDKNDVTGNYDITVDEGILTVFGDAIDENSGDLNESGNISGGVLGDGEDDEPQIALSVKTQNGGAVYLRLKSFGSYNGAKWSDGYEYPKTYSGYSFNYLTGDTLKHAGYSAERISITVYGTGYYLPYYMAMGDFDYDKQTSDVYYSGREKNYSLEYYNYNYLSAPVTANLSGKQIDDYTSFVHANYTSVPSSTKAYLQSIIDGQGWKADDKDLLKNIAQYVKGAATYSLSYDRALDSESDIVLAFLRDYKQGICQHYASAATLLYRQMGIPARYTIGYVASTVADEWTMVTTENAHAWVEVYLDSIGWIQLEVTGGGVADNIQGGTGNGGGSGDNGNGGENGENADNVFSVKPVTEYYKYDGRTTFTHSGAVQGLSKLTEKGYTYEAEISGSYKSPGKYTVSIVSLIIFDSAGNDVTEEYDINFKSGILQVYQYEITVTTGGNSKTYDGSPLSSEECSISTGHLAEGHSLAYFRTLSSRTDVGVSINTYEIKIVDASGADVTYKYRINSSYGLLVVTAREITVTAGSAEKVYNGVTLTCNQYDLQGTLAAGHRAEVVISGSNSGKAGTAENKVKSITIYDASGNNVTLNYKITTVNGLLTVYPN